MQKWHEKRIEALCQQKQKTKAYSETYQASDLELFAKLVNDWKLLTIFERNFCLRCLTGSE